jgi:hypothetical protein
VQVLLQVPRPPARPLPTAGPQQAARGLDIGCGANLIYCLLGASLYGWHMTGVDVTQVAQNWAQRNLQANPQLAHLLEVRLVGQQEGQQEARQEGRQEGQEVQLAQEEVRVGWRWGAARGPSQPARSPRAGGRAGGGGPASL